MKELSIFVDESGDFGPYAAHSPFYLVTLVLHDQSRSMEDSLRKLRFSLENLGFGGEFVIHAGPIIRREENFAQMTPNERRALFSKFFFFATRAPVRFRTFVFEKRRDEALLRFEMRIARELVAFLRSNRGLFESFDKVILYYDNGQHELTRILNAVFSSELPNYDIRSVSPRDYRLFQIADLFCTLKLMGLKAERKGLSKSELLLFHSIHDFRKQFLKPIKRLELP